MSTPLRILIVGDSEDDALLILSALRQGGYEPSFTRVETAESFIHSTEVKCWDCIIADYDVPQFNVFASLIRERGLDLPLIVVSGAVGEERAVEAMKAGAHDYVMKGNIARLVPAIEREMQETAIRRERNQAARALAESERRFRALVENSSDGVALVELDGAILYAGPSTKRILGYESADVVGRNVFDFIHPEDIESTKSMFIEMIGEPTRTINGLLRLLHSDGSWRWIEHVSKNLVNESGVQAVVSNYRDVTERRRAEEVIRLSEKKYRDIFEFAPIGIFQSTPSGRFIA
ncbi:MAG TPA: PAS domain S-box protein, partial [Blastocatellia bacterium]